MSSNDYDVEDVEDVEELKQSYECLLMEYTRLKEEYQENTIIQSMNDMKKRYDELLETTVSIYKYNRLKTRMEASNNRIIAAVILLERILELLKPVNANGGYLSTTNCFKAELEMSIIKDILEHTMNQKNENTT